MVTLWASDPIILFAGLAGFIALSMAISITLVILVLRVLRTAALRHESQLIATWQPIIVQAVIEPISSTPILQKRDFITIMRIWNYFRESVRGGGADKLIEFARQLNLPEFCLSRLDKASFKEKVLIITTLGNLQQPEFIALGKTMLNSANAALSFSAAKAMLRINAQSTIAEIMPLMRTRADWPSTEAIVILQEIGPNIVTPTLTKELLRAQQNEDELPRMLNYLAAGHPGPLSLVINVLLEASSRVEVIVPCLRSVNDPSQRNAVLRLINHPDWRVRAEAVSALGRVGNADDLDAIFERLSDDEWWVRYHAAQAVVNARYVDRDIALQIAERSEDRFAHDMLLQAIAEKWT